MKPGSLSDFQTTKPFSRRPTVHSIQISWCNGTGGGTLSYDALVKALPPSPYPFPEQKDIVTENITFLQCLGAGGNNFYIEAFSDNSELTNISWKVQKTLNGLLCSSFCMSD